MSGGVPAGELKPCPFCGQDGKALVGPIRDGAAVCCSNFKCLGQVQAFNPNAREKAITAWNTRATPTPSIEGRDAGVERVEVVAKAMFEASPYNMGTTWESVSLRRYNGTSDTREMYLTLARAALQALGERP